MSNPVIYRKTHGKTISYRYVKVLVTGRDKKDRKQYIYNPHRVEYAFYVLLNSGKKCRCSVG